MVEKDQSVPVASRISLSLLSEINKEIKESKISISDFIRSACEEKIYNDDREAINSKIDYYKEQILILETKRDKLQDKSENLKTIPKNQINWLIETEKLVNENPQFIKGRIDLYKNKFGIHYRISIQEFLELLEKAKEQYTESETLNQLKVIKK